MKASSSLLPISAPPCSWSRLVPLCQWGEDTWQQLAAPVWTVSSQTVPLYSHLYRVIDVKPGTSSSSSQCPDRMQSQEDHQRSWVMRSRAVSRGNVTGRGEGRGRMVSRDDGCSVRILHTWQSVSEPATNSYTIPDAGRELLDITWYNADGARSCQHIFFFLSCLLENWLHYSIRQWQCCSNAIKYNVYFCCFCWNIFMIVYLCIVLTLPWNDHNVLHSSPHLPHTVESEKQSSLGPRHSLNRPSTCH